MKKYDLVLLTDSRYVNPEIIDLYIRNLLNEDVMLLNALNEHNIKATRVDWADKAFDWSSTRFAIFRSTWDYFDRINEFKSWLKNSKEKLQFINPVEIIIWNLDKHYLQDLLKAGVSIPDTLFIEKGDKVSLRGIIEKTGWQEVILKPAISGTARHTYRIKTENIEAHEGIFQALVAQEAMLLQPFQKSVTTRGEVALMYFNGIYSHAVLKIAKEGDFRVQDDFGGTVHDYQPTTEEMKLGGKAIQACSSLPIYARVDIINNNDGKPVVIELELIEPELWFRHCPEAAKTLAAVIASRLKAN